LGRFEMKFFILLAVLGVAALSVPSLGMASVAAAPATMILLAL
jgi:hypothetical protein